MYNCNLQQLTKGSSTSMRFGGTPVRGKMHLRTPIPMGYVELLDYLGASFTEGLGGLIPTKTPRAMASSLVLVCWMLLLSSMWPLLPVFRRIVYGFSAESLLLVTFSYCAPSTPHVALPVSFSPVERARTAREPRPDLYGGRLRLCLSRTDYDTREDYRLRARTPATPVLCCQGAPLHR
ncbi:uncharacterized protein HD556DRAFT_255606 [Suillus plorans]|uniref:Uncharacterized protein n=1 Tax=Suillus plorans TaxID=116603 RepID=A0A9P7DL07_9AGAM|nr:uncharacterized protein HD556DRAFT_255606 [Suillus plorans]KAG1797427.1 hypothetical protein HD556DRAFT_255606 [Suillus plorans]